MNKAALLDNISIVLVDAKTPANIGATARSMMNMGLSRLILVRPPKDPLHDAARLAAGADVVLDQGEIFQTLEEAAAGHGLVFGASRHKGRLRKNVRTPREAARAIIPLLPQNRIAVVFGNEINGLTLEDLALCQELISIPSSDAFPSLNLAHAVMIIAYELFFVSGMQISPADEELARAETTEDFYQHLQKTLENIEFLDLGKPDRIMFSLRQIFGRSRLSKRDVAILRGILSAVDRAVPSRHNKK